MNGSGDPRIAELVAAAAFHPLRQWLQQREINLYKRPAMTTELPPSLVTLLVDLEEAVLAGDAFRAHTIAQALRRELAAQGIDAPDLEDRLRALLAELATSTHVSDPLEVFRGNPEPDLGHGVVYPVWFGTNRKPDGDGFGRERHPDTTLGRVLVHIPKAHRFGETGSSFWRKLLRLDFRDDRLRITDIAVQDSDDFFAGLQRTMQAARDSGDAPQALLFLHGYNTTFEDAAIRAAQIGYDLKVPGATAFFSWPSAGRIPAYFADEAAIEASEPALTAFLVDFAARAGAEKIHVIAHSMGNRGLLRALQRIAGDVETRGKVQFGQIFLAAPDVDRDLFLGLAGLYPLHGERTTLYASDGDHAVHLSAVLRNAPRAGYFEPYTVAAGVDTIAVPDFDVELLGHSYFAQAEALLHDIHDLMRHGEAPDQRQRVIRDAHDGLKFWRFLR